MFGRVVSRLHHWFAPHPGNNFRARLLHNSGMLALIGIFLGLNLLIRLLDSPRLHILGFTSSITIDEVVRVTNEQRLAAGLPALNYSETLADAARRKAANMFAENYWAHNSPSGLTPWHWFQAAGYSYVHAGENLAKDFGSTDRMIGAWMDSPTHRDNILSPNYSELGLAVVPGMLEGQETVLVVQLFGSREGGAVPQTASVTPSTQGVSTARPALIAETQPAPPTIVPQTTVAAPPTTISGALPAASPSPVAALLNLVNEFSVKQLVAVLTTILLLAVLTVDLILAESQALSRRVGKNWAHIIYLNVILILVTLVQAGRIL